MVELEIALESIEVLRDAVVLKPLGGGRASASWLLACGSDRLVLRKDLPLATALGLDRVAELDFLESATGLGPQVVWADPENGVLVTRWIEGTPWLPEQLESTAGLIRLGGLLRDVHKMPVSGKVFQARRIARRYARQSNQPNVDLLAAEAAHLAQQLAHGFEPAICHMDVHAGNIIGDGELRLLDWEYAAVGDPLMDLAVTIGFHGLDRAQQRILLEAWMGSDSDEQWDRLQACCRLYDLLSKLWQQVVNTDSAS